MPTTNVTRTRRDNGEGTALKQRKDGRRFRQITVDGKKKFIYGKTKAEVNQKFREFKKILDNGTYRVIQKQTVGDYVLHWLTTYKRYHQFRQPVGRCIKTHPADRKICRVCACVMLFISLSVYDKDRHLFQNYRCSGFLPTHVL